MWGATGLNFSDLNMTKEFFKLSVSQDYIDLYIRTIDALV